MAAKKRRADMTEEERRKQTEAAARENAIFETAEEFRKAVNKYFAECDADGLLYGEAGMCLALSQYNKKKRSVTLQALRRWYDGECCTHLQDDVQMAYLRIQNQIDTNPVYHEKNMATRGIFLQKQPRLGGYQDRFETKNDMTVKIVHGTSVDEDDFK